MRPFTNKELLDRFASLPTFTHWPDELELYVRSRADAFNLFDDRFFSFRKNAAGEMEFLQVRQGTTNAGSYGLMHFNEYNHEGCAVLASDTIFYDAYAFGHHKHINDSNHEAYVQVKPVDYYRDNNRNQKAEEIGKRRSGLIGANIHRAGVDSTVINNWSTACQVTKKLADFKAWIDDKKRHGKPVVTLCILKEWPTNSATDQPAITKPSIESDANTFKENSLTTANSEELPTPTEITKTQETSTAEGKETLEVTAKNEQDVNAPAVIDGAKPYNEIGLKQTLINDAKPFLPANGGLQMLSDYAEKASGWPAWVIALIGKLAIIILVITVGWVLYRLAAWVMHSWKENERVKLTAVINSDPTRKDLELK